jgi:hypothetical protein
VGEEISKDFKVNTMNTFSIAISKMLRQIGVEEETEQFIPAQVINGKYIGVEYLYRLDDVIRLMPKIGEKMGWKNTGNRRDGVCGEPTVHDYSSAIYDAFMLGDYPESEKVLLDLLKEHA